MEEHALLACSLWLSQNHLARVGITLGGLGTLTSSINQENAPTDFPTNNLMEAIPQGSLLSEDPSLCQVEKYLISQFEVSA